MLNYKCKTHGLLAPAEIVRWCSGNADRWCLHCVNNMMDKFCGKPELVKEEKEE